MKVRFNSRNSDWLLQFPVVWYISQKFTSTATSSELLGLSSLWCAALQSIYSTAQYTQLASNRTAYNATITFKVRKHHLPQYLVQLIEDYATTQQLRSSYKNLLAVPYVKTDTAARAFRVSAPTIWNSLLTLVKSSSTLVTFKWHLKTFLYRRAFDWPLILRASELPYWQITAHYKFTDWLIDWIVANKQGQQYSVACRFSCHTAEFPVCHGKTNCPFFLQHLYLIQVFWAFFNFTIHKTIKSSSCKLTFMMIMTNLWQYFHH